jgi:hypothetical protein
MEPPPFREKVLLILRYDPERLSSIESAHVVVLPEGRRCLIVAQENENFASVPGFDMDVRRLVFPRGRVHVDLEASLVAGLDHGKS